MSTINELKKLTDRKPRDLSEWLQLWPEDDREVIVNAILYAETSQAFEALRNLEPHPYPFQRSTIPHHRRQLKLGGLHV